MLASSRAISGGDTVGMYWPFDSSGGLRHVADRGASGNDDAGLAVSCLGRNGQVPDTLSGPEDASGDSTSVNAHSVQSWVREGDLKCLMGVTCSESGVLQPAEVLELLLSLGGSAQKARSLAAELLERFGSLGAVVAAEPIKLKQVLHSNTLCILLLAAVRTAVKAIMHEPLEDRPVVSSASTLMEYLSLTMRYEPTEVTRLLFLDRKNGLIKDEVQHRGTVDHTPLYIREVVKRALELGASAVILVHNHLSCDPKPSKDDIRMTRQLVAALQTINVVLHDHVIVGRNKEFSLRKAALI
jgi:DNA repair protein RadC